MLAETTHYVDALDIDRQLARMGLKREAFVLAAQEALAAFASCTDNDPPTFPGTSAWAAANRSLRENLFTSGWTRKNETNQPLTLNEAQTIALTALSGDSGTGREDRHPLTRSARGPRTKDLVRSNQRILPFPDLAPIVASTKVPGRATWLFLIYRDEKAKEMRCELSLPTRMDDKGNVLQWAERIIFPPTPIDIKDIPVSEDAGGQSPEITVEIRRIG